MLLKLNSAALTNFLKISETIDEHLSICNFSIGVFSRTSTVYLVLSLVLFLDI